MLGDVAGQPLPVANLTSPVTFALPAAAMALSEQHAACTWWDARAAQLSPSGCVAAPNPAPPPPAHTVAFRRTAGDAGGLTPASSSAADGALAFQTPSDASLAGGWELRGPLAQNCSTLVMDCAAAAAAAASGRAPAPGPYLDPTDPFTYGRASCSAASPAGMTERRAWRSLPMAAQPA